MRAIFLDRDGVICLNRPDHVKSLGEFTFLARAREGLARLAVTDMPIIVITNQAAINRGMVSAEMVEAIHQQMITEVEAAGGRIDGIYFCPHRPDERCDCRKPGTGLLQQAAADFGIELTGSYLIGDAWTDLQAGLSVGCTTLLVLTGRGLRQVLTGLHKGQGRFHVVRDLSEAVTMILEAEGYSPYEMAWSRLADEALGEAKEQRFGHVP